MENKFAVQTKELISASREIAIDMGYDHITTIHFLFADCEQDYPLSIKNFCFPDKEMYLKYKQENIRTVKSILENISSSLPLTKEAEITLRQAEMERRKTGQQEVHPHHIFMAAFKNKDTVLSQVFIDTPNILLNLEKFYLYSGAFDLVMPSNKTSQTKINRIERNYKSATDFIKKFFR